MRIFVIALGAAALISGCGGNTPVSSSSGGGAGVVSQASAGFATPTRTLANAADGETFDASASVITVESSGISLDPKKIVFTATSDPNSIRVNYEGVDYLATFNSTRNRFEAATARGMLVIIGQGSGFGTGDFARSLYVFDSDNSTYYNGAFTVAGYNTDPATVGARTTIATYTGPASIQVDQVGGFEGETGTVTLTADFGAATMNGSMSFTDMNSGFGTTPLDMKATTMTLSGGKIQGNSFSADLSVNAGDLAASSVDSAKLNGAFYGDTAQEVAGTFSGTGTSSATNGPLIFQGAFFGKE